MRTRKAATLIEVIVVIVTLAVLMGLVIGSVQKVRLAASVMRLKNQTRQLSLAVLSVESDHGRLPAHFNMTTGASLVGFMLPKLDYPANTPYATVPIPAFMSKTDPSYNFYPTRIDGTPGDSSFALNYLIFLLDNSSTQVTDGRSHTVMLSERYARCGPIANIVLSVAALFSKTPSGAISPITGYTARPITFADLHFDDVLPVYDPSSRTSLPSTPGLTFQVAPRPDACDPRILQASTRSGLVVAMMDGSVRTISPSISPAVYWSSLTPDRGEAVSLD